MIHINLYKYIYLYIAFLNVHGCYRYDEADLFDCYQDKIMILELIGTQLEIESK